MKKIKPIGKDNKMVRAQQQRYLRGAVEKAEQEERLGYYYSAEWSVEEKFKTQPKEIVFLYRQAATGDKVLRQKHVIGSGKRKDLCEFKVTGDSYQAGGRVLAWRAELYAGDELQAYEQSYMWE